MVPSGPPTGVGSAQSMPSSLLRTNSGLLGAQPGSIPSQQPFSSLVSPRAQFNGVANGNTMALLGGISNVSSLLNHSFGNGVPNSGAGISAQQMNSQQRGGMGNSSVDILGSAEPDQLSFPSPTGPLQGQHLQNPSVTQMGDHSHSQSQQLDMVQNFPQQLTVPHSQHQQQRGGLGNVGSMAQVKLETQIGSNDQSFSGQQLQTMRSIGPVKMEPQQLQSVRSLVPVKLEHQHTDSSLYLQQHQQQHQQQHSQQQLLQMSRSTPHAANAAAQMNLLQQQRLLQLQQQQQLFKALPQRAQLQQQLQHGLPIRPQMKTTTYEPGMCARRLTQYMYNQQRRPEDNNIEFWRNFVKEFFAPNAKKRWCVSLYGSGRQTIGVFPQDVWHCELCNRKPGRGFEATVEVLPRLLQIKYASGTLEELLYVDMPHESQNTSGQIVLDYAKAVQESVFEQLRVVRDGQLRIIFNSDLKIASWEFCARRHEELIPRRLIIPQVSQLGTVVQKYQTASQNSSSGLSLQDLQNTCNSFVASARQLAKALEVPLVNDLGYTKRYVRFLQISEVVNSMKDLIDYSRHTGTGPMDSLINFPKRNSSGLHSQQSQPQGTQQNVVQNSSQNDQNSLNSHGTGIVSSNNGVAVVNNSLNAPSLTSTSGTSIISLLHQNSMNSRQENLMNSSNNMYGGGNPVQIPSASSSNSIPPCQPHPSSSLLSPTPTSSDTMIPATHNSRLNPLTLTPNMPAMQQQVTQTREPDLTDSQSSVQQIWNEIMMSSQLNGVGAMGNDMKRINSVPTGLNGSNGITNSLGGNSGVGGIGFGVMGGIGPSVSSSGLKATMANNALNRVGMNHLTQDSSAISHQQQQDMESRLLGGLESVNSFSNMQFDWKPSP
ncbi:transcriptional corepressor SEUSS [Dendrobium catenatum]|uniref:Transcriptional corepressor SEUSS n=1 Tax=Dendrobium catenatum TaxID=906689 RepID=A0A2I0W5I4_9ASPA|nr:transcriptional corepressor SEUSS [Dendrobium catenatum]PKU70913.1 Transcriptional corepressor SEUSS [Dendrobium catenatum]